MTSKKNRPAKRQPGRPSKEKPQKHQFNASRLLAQEISRIRRAVLRHSHRAIALSKDFGTSAKPAKKWRDSILRLLHRLET